MLRAFVYMSMVVFMSEVDAKRKAEEEAETARKKAEAQASERIPKEGEEVEREDQQGTQDQTAKERNRRLAEVQQADPNVLRTPKASEHVHACGVHPADDCSETGLRRSQSSSLCPDREAAMRKDSFPAGRGKRNEFTVRTFKIY